MKNKTEQFNSLQTTKLGRIGEKYMNEFASAKGAELYLPSNNGSFSTDGFCRDIVKRHIEYNLEVKTKPRMKFYAQTGYDLNDHYKYLSLCSHTCIIFVDHIAQSIYYGWAHKLNADPGKIEQADKNYVLFPLSAMTEYRKLTNQEIDELKKNSQSNYYN